MNVIGIDPGLKGAVAYIDSVAGITVFDTPTIKKSKGRDYDYSQMALLLKSMKIMGAVHVFLEMAHAMPKQGVVSSFSFGKGYGAWIMAIAGVLELPYTLITAASWTKAMMQGVGKKDYKLRAVQLFPQCAEQITTIDRASALLIAEYGRRALEGERN